MELKPCPFTNSVATVSCTPGSDGKEWHVGARRGALLGPFRSKDEAITAWNTRHPDTQALVEAVRPFVSAWDEAQLWKEFDGADCREIALANSMSLDEWEALTQALSTFTGDTK